MKLDRITDSLHDIWDNVAEGWRHLRQTASGALTRFRPGNKTNLPKPSEIDDSHYLPTLGWSMLGGDVFEDDKRLVIRLEIPGMEKEDINIEITDDALVVSGEKRFQNEQTSGRWRMMQCAYGSFRRVVPLPAAVTPEAASARYQHGVLRIELPKLTPSAPKPTRIIVR